MYEELAKNFLAIQAKKSKQRLKINDLSKDFNMGEAGIIAYLTFVKNGINAGELSEALQVSTARIASILNALENKHSITRIVDKRDKRRVIIYIDQKVKKDTIKRWNFSIKQIAKVFEAMGEKDTIELLRLLDKMGNIIDNQVCLAGGSKKC
ncbi:MAG TPA: MarR family winged helix-turn-helix transcriptional regulator [Bacilli bacterium]|nr:MarR family winged helix-turn-helix transcriptional regulator [Bacilli bacterium]